MLWQTLLPTARKGHSWSKRRAWRSLLKDNRSFQTPWALTLDHLSDQNSPKLNLQPPKTTQVPREVITHLV